MKAADTMLLPRAIPISRSPSDIQPHNPNEGATGSLVFLYILQAPKAHHRRGFCFPTEKRCRGEAVPLPKPPLCKGRCQKSLIFDGGIVKMLRYKSIPQLVLAGCQSPAGDPVAALTVHRTVIHYRDCASLTLYTREPFCAYPPTTAVIARA